MHDRPVAGVEHGGGRDFLDHRRTVHHVPGQQVLAAVDAGHVVPPGLAQGQALEPDAALAEQSLGRGCRPALREDGQLRRIDASDGGRAEAYDLQRRLGIGVPEPLAVRLVELAGSPAQAVSRSPDSISGNS